MGEAIVERLLRTKVCTIDNTAWHRERARCEIIVHVYVCGLSLQGNHAHTNASQHSDGGTGGGTTGTCYTWKSYAKPYQKFVNWESYDFG